MIKITKSIFDCLETEDSLKISDIESSFTRYYNCYLHEMAIKIFYSKLINKAKPYHYEGSVFNHTKLVLNFMKDHEDDLGYDDIDYLIGFFHDIGEFDAVYDKINTLNIDKYEKKYLYDKYVTKNNPKFKYLDMISINNRGHEIYSANLASRYLDKVFHLDDSVIKEVTFCIQYHMQGYFISKMTNESEVKILLNSPYLDRLKRIWLADENGRISDDPKISIEDIQKRIESNIFYKKYSK